MINKLILDAPFNSLSFGNVSYNFLRELYKHEDLEIIIFPQGDKADFSAFEPSQEFLYKFRESCNNKLKKYSGDIPTLKLWHINGAERKLTNKQFLYTFHELDFATEEEINIINSQTHTFFSSSFSKNVFDTFGADCDKTSYIPIGFDTDFYETKRPRQNVPQVIFGLMGKFEKRKHTAKILKLWAQRYGNNPKYQLITCITNPFFNEEQNNALISNALEGKRYFNINFLPWMKTNKEVNEIMNVVDINLSGLSGSEGFNIMSFNSLCLGKQSIVLNATAHKDWATKENSILVEPNGAENAIDNIFFKPNEPFNQGNIYTFSDESFYEATEKAILKAKQYNSEGAKLKEMTYKNTIDKILETINSYQS